MACTKLGPDVIIIFNIRATYILQYLDYELIDHLRNESWNLSLQHHLNVDFYCGEAYMKSAMEDPGSLQGLNDLQHCITQWDKVPRGINGGNSSGFSAELRHRKNGFEWASLCSVSVISAFYVLKYFEQKKKIHLQLLSFLNNVVAQVLEILFLS